ncbi:hypothetical protein L1987_11244 [Smallanthus sonchifolius]|uniref:Uncharacterized protein n=1 Tax=Smallanthus sonchifolius TaxID=185202 RepID=A0ACB9JBY6_9ASTR|nr:hypothetical protein L1987_11244 [Smallanthus sonchifolius]
MREKGLLVTDEIRNEKNLCERYDTGERSSAVREARSPTGENLLEFIELLSLSSEETEAKSSSEDSSKFPSPELLKSLSERSNRFIGGDINNAIKVNEVQIYLRPAQSLRFFLYPIFCHNFRSREQEGRDVFHNGIC